MPFFCAVPPSLPADPEGVGVIPGAGPYHVTSFVPDRRITVERNRFYRGRRPHHLSSIVVDLTTTDYDELIDRVEAGSLDWAFAPATVYFARLAELKQKYGVNRSRFFVRPGLFLRGFALNTSRPLLRNNAPLRRAINYAADRPALLRQRGPGAGTPTDQYLPPGLPGAPKSHPYPLGGPNFRKARALAKGHLRSGRAVVYVPALPFAVAQGQILKTDLARIGLTVAVKSFPAPQPYFDRVGTRGEPFDLAWEGWTPDYVDPYSYLVPLFGAGIQAKGNTNTSYFHSAAYARLFARAGALQGAARYRAYGRIAAKLARDTAPFLAYSFDNTPTLVSSRVGCIILRPELDVGAACLK
jgi:peptide/nickel transport system substrate-binding protein